MHGDESGMRPKAVMSTCSRRTFTRTATGGLLAFLAAPVHALGDHERFFAAEAARMRREAIAAGDQAFGAVIVKDGEIVGYGPSRVVVDRDPDAHAERVALRDAVRRIGAEQVGGAVLYSTSRPCATCEAALAAAGIARMHHGPNASEAGPPRRR